MSIYVCNDRTNSYYEPYVTATMDLRDIIYGEEVEIDDDWTLTDGGMIWGRYKTNSSLPHLHEQNYRYVMLSDAEKRHENFSKKAAAATTETSQAKQAIFTEDEEEDV